MSVSVVHSSLVSVSVVHSSLVSVSVGLLYTYDAADDLLCVDHGGRRII